MPLQVMSYTSLVHGGQAFCNRLCGSTTRHGTQWDSLEIYFRELVLIKWIQVLSIYNIHNSNLHVLLLKLRIVTPDVIKRRF